MDIVRTPYSKRYTKLVTLNQPKCESETYYNDLKDTKILLSYQI